MINWGIFAKLLATKQLKLEKGEMSLFGMPIIFCPVPFLVDFQKYLEEKYGYEKAKELLIEGFKLGGADFTTNYAKTYHFKHKKEIIRWSLDLMSNAGWGVYSIMDLDEEKCFARFKLKNSPFAKMIKSTKPVDHIIVGLIKGVAEKLIFECPMDVVEIKCEAVGDSFCEIIAKPKAKSAKNHKGKKPENQLD